MAIKTRQAYIHPLDTAEYRLEYQDGTDRTFRARNDEEAMVFTAGILNRRIGKKDGFQRAGGKALTCGGRQVFPPKKISRRARA